MDLKQSAIVLIFNKRGQMALQRRAAHDARHPSAWDFSAGGGIDPDEDHETAAIRETKEEIGVDVKVQFVDEQVYKDGEREDHLYLFCATHEGPFTVDPNEVQEVKFFDIDEIHNMMMHGEKFHPEFPFAWNLGIIARAAKLVESIG